MNTISWFGLGLVLLGVVAIRRAAPNSDGMFLTSGELLIMFGGGLMGAAIALYYFKDRV